METLFGHKPVMSISYSNDEIIKDIMTLHEIEFFDLDCTYSKGVFWKNLPEPTHKTDLYPQSSDVIEANSIDLPFESDSMENIMFDPPFIIVGKSYKDNKKGSSIMAKRFEGYENFQQLKDHYIGTLKETYRLLKEGGTLVFKCQDVVSSGKNHFTHCLVMQMAMQVGFYAMDLHILLSKNRVNAFNGQKWQNQFHARKYHSYFWVFKKVKNRVDYSF